MFLPSRVLHVAATFAAAAGVPNESRFHLLLVVPSGLRNEGYACGDSV